MDNSEHIREEYHRNPSEFIEKYGSSPYSNSEPVQCTALRSISEPDNTKMCEIYSEIVENIMGVINTPIAGSDLSDIGNNIGLIIGKYISPKMGFELSDFIDGLEHGVSIANGTH